MIEDARQIPPGTVLEADLCIIGGGPAGLSIALELANTGRKVIVLVGGGRREQEDYRDLYRGHASPPGSHEPLEENRPRVLGGGTTVWGSRCVPYDPVDFERRDWIPHSGWPITYESLRGHFDRASILCETGHFDFDARSTFPGKQPEMIAGFDSAELATWPLERWGPPTDFGRRYARDLSRASNLSVLLHAHATHLQLEAHGGALRQVDAASAPGRAFVVRAKRYVLACGGLENARLLLAADDVAKAGIGNHSDCVGRFYQAHLFGVIGHARLRDPNKDFIYEFERDREGVYCRRRFWVTPEAQQRLRIGNGIGFFFRPPIAHAVHRNALSSALFLGKFTVSSLKRLGLRGAVARARNERRVLGEHLEVVLRNAPGLAPQVVRLIQQRFFARRRLPIVLAPRSTNQFHLFYQTEHAPNPESRVVLHQDRDAFGMRRLEARIRFEQVDFQSVLQLHRLMRERFAASGVGEFIYEEAELRAKLEDEARKFNSNAHHIGTTRMSEDPARGVVDPQCRVHGVENFYLAGSSVFPTSSHANPTLTLVAVALRLADHLKAELA